MAEKKPKAKKPKNYAKLSQKQKFIAAAKAAEADDTETKFTDAFKRIVKVKRSLAP